MNLIKFIIICRFFDVSQEGRNCTDFKNYEDDNIIINDDNIDLRLSLINENEYYENNKIAQEFSVCYKNKFNNHKNLLRIKIDYFINKDNIDESDLNSININYNKNLLTKFLIISNDKDNLLNKLLKEYNYLNFDKNLSAQIIYYSPSPIDDKDEKDKKKLFEIIKESIPYIIKYSIQYYFMKETAIKHNKKIINKFNNDRLNNNFNIKYIFGFLALAFLIFFIISFIFHFSSFISFIISSILTTIIFYFIFPFLFFKFLISIFLFLIIPVSVIKIIISYFPSFLNNFYKFFSYLFNSIFSKYDFYNVMKKVFNPEDSSYFGSFLAIITVTLALIIILIKIGKQEQSYRENLKSIFLSLVSESPSIFQPYASGKVYNMEFFLVIDYRYIICKNFVGLCIAYEKYIKNSIKKNNLFSDKTIDTLIEDFVSEHLSLSNPIKILKDFFKGGS